MDVRTVMRMELKEVGANYVIGALVGLEFPSPI